MNTINKNALIAVTVVGTLAAVSVWWVKRSKKNPAPVDVNAVAPTEVRSAWRQKMRGIAEAARLIAGIVASLAAIIWSIKIIIRLIIGA